MKAYAFSLLTLVALTSVGIFLVARQPSGSPPPPIFITPTASANKPEILAPVLSPIPAPLPTQAPPATAPAHEVKQMTLPAGTGHPVPSSPDDKPFAQDRTTIQGLAASNNPANVTFIAPYLEHADAGIRQEAVLGLLTLGAKSGVPFLLAATAKAHSPEEAQTLKEAADFLNKGVPETLAPPPDPEPTNEANPVDLLPPNP